MSKRKGQGGQSIANSDTAQAVLLTDLRQLIEQAKQAAAVAVNTVLTMIC